MWVLHSHANLRELTFSSELANLLHGHATSDHGNSEVCCIRYPIDRILSQGFPASGGIHPAAVLVHRSFVAIFVASVRTGRYGVFNQAFLRSSAHSDGALGIELAQQASVV